MKYTLVQHSGFGYGGNPQFEAAVETRSFDTGREAARVVKAGGLLFNDYGEASDWAEAENYPPEVRGLIPECRGSFSRAEIDGLRIYVPKGGKP